MGRQVTALISLPVELLLENKTSTSPAKLVPVQSFLHELSSLQFATKAELPDHTDCARGTVAYLLPAVVVEGCSECILLLLYFRMQGLAY